MPYELRSREADARHSDAQESPTSTEPPSLDDLPEEIIANVAAHMSYKELASFARISKRYKRIAYADLYYTAMHDRQVWCNTWSIAKNDGLITNIREMDVDFSYVLRSRRDHMDGQIALRTLHDATLIQKLRIEDMTRLPSSVNQPWWLKFFRITNPSTEVQPRNSFEHLKHLEIESDFVPLREIAQIFRLPSLRFLQLEDMSNDGPLLDDAIAPPASSCNIQHLELHGCRLDSAIVAQILVSLRTLETFKYDHGHPETEPIFSWRIIGDALQKHASTLRTLWALNMGEFNDDEEASEEPTSTTIGSLKDFRCLQILTLPLHSLNSLRDGAVRLENYLPPNAEAISLFIIPNRIAPSQCAATIRTVEKLRPERFQCSMPKGAPYGDLQLSSTLVALADAGITAKPTRLLTKWDYFGRLVAHETLREMEAEGYEDSESSGDEGSEDGDAGEASDADDGAGT